MRAPDKALPYVPRDYFLTHTWDHRRGEHVTIIGPTGAGKTLLGYQLLQHSTNREYPGVVAVMKPRDSTATAWNKALGYKKIRAWPPVATRWKPIRPPGWTLWPSHTFNADVDDARLQLEFTRALRDVYRRGGIFFPDEGAGLAKDLHMYNDMRAVWQRGRSMDASIFCASQRPVDLPPYAYNCAQHLFLAYDADKRNRDRFVEIGGVDSRTVEHEVMGLEKFEWLYIRRDDRLMCIVGR